MKYSTIITGAGFVTVSVVPREVTGTGRILVMFYGYWQLISINAIVRGFCNRLFYLLIFVGTSRCTYINFVSKNCSFFGMCLFNVAALRSKQ